ncbi:hypothetical protein Calab_0153 [Caldithrix abyssi DSM 13497]|uniref:Uncharacterized protein n=1 Tax=Caldithrix abyssi DSM 13497 TaxID=880073 RepID=H1XYI8_CALAY|nr:hypothetical protein Calab_0153 [Caldithrix abyssi DSM 13497]
MNQRAILIRPYGTGLGLVRFIIPAVETTGYCQSSLTGRVWLVLGWHIVPAIEMTGYCQTSFKNSEMVDFNSKKFDRG